MFEVSVAWVRLETSAFGGDKVGESCHLLWVQVQVGAIDLVESPEEVFGCAINIVAARVIGEVVAQGGASQFLLEQIDLVQEEDDTGSHKPSGVDY
jgi:hypothetical protein